MAEEKSILKKLYKKIEAAKEFRKNDKRFDEAKEIIKYIEGQYGYTEDDNKYIVNTFYNLYNLIPPNLYYQDPHVRVKPSRDYNPEKEKDDTYGMNNNVVMTKAVEKIINKLYQSMGMGTEFLDAIQDSLSYPFGVLKIGLSPNQESNDDFDYISEGDFFVQRVTPTSILYDPQATNEDNARYFIHVIVRPLEDVKANKKYKNTKKLKGYTLKTSRKEKESFVPGGEGSNDRSDDGTRWITEYEFYDVKEEMIYTIADESIKGSTEPGTMLWERKNNMPFKGAPFKFLYYSGNPDKFGGIAPLAMVKDEALALNDTLSMMLKHLQRFPGVIIYEDGSVNEMDLDEFEKGKQGAILRVNPNAIQGNQIQRLSPLSSGGEYYQVMNLLSALIDKILGVADYQRATAASGRRKTATEVSYEAADSSVRRSFMVNFVKGFIERTVSCLAKMVFEFYDKEMFVNYEGDLNLDWTEVSVKDLKDDYLFEIDVNDMREFSGNQARAIIEFLGVLSQQPVLQSVLQAYDPDKIAKLIAESLDINPARIMKDIRITHKENDPYAENNAAEAGERVPEPNPGENHRQHIEIHKQKYMQLINEQKMDFANELYRHMELTMQLLQAEQVQTGQQTQQQPQIQSPNPLQTQGPSQAEAAGGFTYGGGTEGMPQ